MVGFLGQLLIGLIICSQFVDKNYPWWSILLDKPIPQWVLFLHLFLIFEQFYSSKFTFNLLNNEAIANLKADISHSLYRN